MDLKSLVAWAKTVKTTDLETKNVERAKNYLVMIIERGELINTYTTKTDSYIKDVMEYLHQLGKLGIETPKINNDPDSLSDDPKD
jgi:D-mannonate dehydratase